MDCLFAWRREAVKTSVRALLEEGFNGNHNQPKSLSTMEPGKVEIGAEAEILLRIDREFGKRIAWLLTG
jgi:hypothetical protein